MELVDPQEAFFPESDGAPMGESGSHVEIMCNTIPTLQGIFAGERVQVGGNQFLYYDRTNPKKVLCPDVYVAFDVETWPRRTWKVWEEGLAPNVIFEFLSRSTAANDLGPKRLVYESLGVEEYFTYDLLEELAPPKLRGWRRVRDRFVDIVAEDGPGETLRSEVLALLLQAEGESLRFLDAESGERILFQGEAVAAAQRDGEAVQREAEAVRREAEVAQREAEAVRRDAEVAQREAEAVRRDAEEVRRGADTEIARLKAELEQLRGER